MQLSGSKLEMEVEQEVAGRVLQAISCPRRTVRGEQLPNVLATLNHHILFQVLHNAAKKLSMHFHLNRLAPGAVQSRDPQVLLTFKDSEFLWSFPEKESEEKKKHEDLRNRFELLFERLLPYSNKEVSCSACPICALLHAINYVFSGL